MVTDSALYFSTASFSFKIIEFELCQRRLCTLLREGKILEADMVVWHVLGSSCWPPLELLRAFWAPPGGLLGGPGAS